MDRINLEVLVFLRQPDGDLELVSLPAENEDMGQATVILDALPKAA